MKTSDNKTLKKTDKELHGNKDNQGSHSRNAKFIDNVNSTDKIDKTISSNESPNYAGLQNGGISNKLSRLNRSVLISHFHQHCFGNDVIGYNSSEEIEEIPFPKEEIRRKQPWRP